MRDSARAERARSFREKQKTEEVAKKTMSKPVGSVTRIGRMFPNAGKITGILLEINFVCWRIPTL